MDSSFTCNDFQCWEVTEQVLTIFVIAFASTLILYKLWFGLLRYKTHNYIARLQDFLEPDLESGRTKKRGRFASVLLGSGPPSGTYGIRSRRLRNRKRRSKSNHGRAAQACSGHDGSVDSGNGLLENFFWEFVGRISMWRVELQEARANDRRGQRRLSSDAHASHSVYIVPRGPRTLQPDPSLVSLDAYPLTSANRSMILSSLDPVARPSSIRQRSTSGSGVFCDSSPDSSARRQASNPPAARNLKLTAGTRSDNCAPQAKPRARITRTTAALARAASANTPQTPKSALSRNATVDGHDRSKPDDGLTEPPRVCTKRRRVSRDSS